MATFIEVSRFALLVLVLSIGCYAAVVQMKLIREIRVDRFWSLFHGTWVFRPKVLSDRGQFLRKRFFKLLLLLALTTLIFWATDWLADNAT